MKLKNILFLILLPLVGVSCNDYLDVMPDSRTEIDTEEKVAQLLSAAYPNFISVMMTETSSDNIDQMDVTTLNTYDAIQEEAWHWRDVTEDVNNDAPQDYWTNAYNCISIANHALEKIEEFGNPLSLQPQKGEALLIRAYNHFGLVNVFGMHWSEKNGKTDLGVPYVTKPERQLISEGERLSVADVYSMIEKDLLAGLPLLDDNSYKVPKYHFNRKAAHAFAARFYLYYRKWDKVIEHVNEIMGDNPQGMMRNRKEFAPLPSDQLQPRAQHWAKMEQNANLLIFCPSSAIATVFGNYSTGKRYQHSRLVATLETTNAPVPWGQYSEPTEDRPLGSYAYNASMYYLPAMSYSSGYYAFPKIPYYFQYTDPIARTGYQKPLFVAFSAEEALLSRAEAYIMKGDYDSALKDMNVWVTAVSSLGNLLSADIINTYYGTMLSEYTPESPEPGKKKLNPEVPFVSPEQENFMQCVLHMRRIETIHDGLRWFDVKRYGIEIHRRKVDANYAVTVLDILSPDDPRRAIQLPAPVVNAGLEANPRN